MNLNQEALAKAKAAPFRKHTIGETISDDAVEIIITAYIEALPHVDRAGVLPEQYALGLIAEEAGEVLQWVGKSLRFGFDTPGRRDPVSGEVTGETPRDLMPPEIGDLLAAIEFAAAHGLIDRTAVEAAKARKLQKLLDPASLDNLGRPLAPQPAVNTSPEGVSGWQPIETAPRDGTHVLVAFAGTSSPNTVAHWFGPHPLPGLQAGAWYLSVQQIEGPPITPTHWQPLPAIPSPTDERSK